MFVCLFAVNGKTTERIDTKCSEITKNESESVLYGLKLPVLVFLERYRDISGFSFAADRHVNLSPFHFWLLPWCLTQNASQKRKNWRQTLRNYKERPEKGPLRVEIAHLRVLGEISWHFQFFLFGRQPFFLISHFWLLLRRCYWITSGHA